MRRLAAAVIALAFSGCASMRPAEPEPPTIPPILDGAALGGVREANQVVRAAFADRELTLLCAVQVEGSGVRVVGVDALGRRVFTVTYDGKEVVADASSMVPEKFAPQYLLADLELALWPLAALQAAYAGTEWAVSQPYPGARRLRRAGRLVAEVHYTGADPWVTRYWISNFERGYVLAVDPRSGER